MTEWQNGCEAGRRGVKRSGGMGEACMLTAVVRLGNMAQRVGRWWRIGPTTGRILDDRDAEKLWGRTYEKGWEIRV